MGMQPISDSLYAVLVRQGLVTERAGTHDETGIKAEERNDALHPELRQGRSSADLKLVWTNLSQPAERRTTAASLPKLVQ